MTTARRGMPIEGAIAFVTGGHRGFGRAVVDELLERGAAKVYATSRSPQPAFDDRVVSITLDVTDDEAVAAAAAAAQDVSILVNNAGVALWSPVLKAPFANIQEELDTNLFGLLRVTRAFAPVLAAHPPSALVNVLSVLAWLSRGSGYEVSKAAAWSATNSIRLGLRDQQTTVTALHVGLMETDMAARFDAPKSDPRDVARQTADAIESGAIEVLADASSRRVKSMLSEDVGALYGM